MADRLIEDNDGAPYPEVYAVWNPTADPPLYLPYPGGRGTGSEDAAEAVVNPNKHLGLKVVRCQLVPVRQAEDEDGWCADCPDREACAMGHPCEHVKDVARKAVAERMTRTDNHTYFSGSAMGHPGGHYG